MKTNTTSSVSESDLQVITRYLQTRPHSVAEIEQVAGMWPAVAKSVWERRVSGITDVLSTELLKAIADGEVDFPALCARLKH